MAVGGRVALQQRHVEPALEQQRAGPVEKHVGKRAELLPQTDLPDRISLEVKRGKVAGAEQGIDALAVGDSGAGGHVVLADHAIAHADLALPAHLAGDAVHAEQKQVLLGVGAGHKNGIAPHHRGRAAAARQGRGPEKILLLAKAGLEVGFRGGTVEQRPAPLRPVAGKHRQKHQSED